jgi:very-short-patch-repair endonuclease
MSMTRTPNPSPLAGEVGARTRSVRAAGEGPGGAVDFGGAGSREPSPGHSLRSRPSSPAREEGESSVAGEMRRRARALRARITDAERKLWFALRDRRFAGFKVPRLVIEVDGGQHAGSLQDRWRDRWFAANGFRVMRLWNNEVLSNLEGVLTVLSAELEQCR